MRRKDSSNKSHRKSPSSLPPATKPYLLPSNPAASSLQPSSKVADMTQSEGHKNLIAIAVTSNLPTPISPCGICRQVIREFLPLQAPIYMVGSTYPFHLEIAPRCLGLEGLKGGEEVVKVMSVEEMLPMSFGPEQLGVKPLIAESGMVKR